MEIKCCSKCGGEAEHIKIWESKRGDCFFRCKNCGRETKVYASKQGAVDAWNSGKLTLTDKDMIELLEKRALAGRMSVQDKQVMLEAAGRIEKLADDNAELEAIVGLRSKREWYTKFVEEVYQKQEGNELSTPDFDYIYEQYFKLAEKIFAEIEKCSEVALMNGHIETPILCIGFGVLAALKKKYIGEDINVSTTMEGENDTFGNSD